MLSWFIKDVKNNQLPQVSWIVAPAGYSEHPSYTPDFGAHYVNTVIQTLFSNPDLWKDTALFVTYDEHDGFFDHRLPLPEAGVTEEHIEGCRSVPAPRSRCSSARRGPGAVTSTPTSTTTPRCSSSWPCWTGVKPANVTPWRASVTGDLTPPSTSSIRTSRSRNIPTLDQTWALTQLTGGSTATPAEGAQKMPTQEPGTRPHRPTNYQLHADVTVDRKTDKVIAALTNTGKVGASFAIYPDALLPSGATPITVLRPPAGSYVWDTTLTAGKYAFSVYGPDGFLTSFAGDVVPAGLDGGPVPVVPAARPGQESEAQPGQRGPQEVEYTLTPNDYEGRTRTVVVHPGGPDHQLADQ